MTDPLRDLERRVDALASRVDLNDQATRACIDAIRADVARLREDGETFVSLERYSPVERIVYGVVAAVLLGVLGAVIALVVKS